MTETVENKMDALNKKLDEVLINFFESLGELYREQANLENYMKNGFLMMSRSRYSMGAKSVGCSQYDENTMKASKIVTISDVDVDINKKFELINLDEYPSEYLKDTDGVKTSGLRQRKAADNDSVENIGSTNGDVGENCTKPKNSRHCHDPIKWFGMLVPQSLRQTQSYFKQALETVVTVSNLKCKVMQLRDLYTHLLKEKQSVTG